jgi:hypothetical protein
VNAYLSQPCNISEIATHSCVMLDAAQQSNKHRKASSWFGVGLVPLATQMIKGDWGL